MCNICLFVGFQQIGNMFAYDSGCNYTSISLFLLQFLYKMFYN